MTSANTAVLEQNEVQSSRANKYFVMNAHAGKGIDPEKVKAADDSLTVYVTTGSGDARKYVSDVLKDDPNAWIIACGGDGTLSECAAGIIDAHAGDTALFSAIGAGSGNDFVRYMSKVMKPGEIKDVDAVYVNGYYSINMINIGFDCAVVSESEKLRRMPHVSGSASYILGVVKTLLKKPHIKAKITLDGVDGTDETKVLEGDYLLTCVAECPFCGGGFNAAPTASPFDGLIDLLIIKNVSRARFISLVGDYKKGTHFLENGELKEIFRKYITHVKCRSFTMDGLTEMCVDGEVISVDKINGEILPRAFRCVLPDEKWVNAVKK